MVGKVMTHLLHSYKFVDAVMLLFRCNDSSVTVSTTCIWCSLEGYLSYEYNFMHIVLCITVIMIFTPTYLELTFTASDSNLVTVFNIFIFCYH